MSLNGMTGFGRASGEDDFGRWSVEARSVNGRSLDVRTSVPPTLEGLDALIKGEARKRFRRGSLQVQVQLSLADAAGGLTIDRAALQSLRRLARKQGLPVTFDGLLSVKGIVSTDRGPQRFSETHRVFKAVLAGVTEALDALKAARAAEGQSLKDTLDTILDELGRETEAAIAHAALQPDQLKSRLEARLAELSGSAGVDPARLAQEVALLAAKADVREEVDRLTAHIADGRTLLSSDEAVGRKLDFLAQEMNREANTLGSKSASLDVTRTSLALKSLVDQFKEQAANVE